jgi:hypothetical protein
MPKKFKFNKMKMLNFLILVIKLTETSSLISSDFCSLNKTIEKWPCLDKHNVRCETNSICASDKKYCEKFDFISRTFNKNNKLARYQAARVTKIRENFENFKQSIPKCELNEEKLICLNNFDCILSKSIVFHEIIISNYEKKVDCKCEGYYPEKCNRNYCGYDLKSCEVFQKFNLTNIKNCENKKTNKLIQRIALL